MHEPPIRAMFCASGPFPRAARVSTVPRPMTDRTTTRTPDLVEAALLEVATVPGGIHRSVLWAAVAARLAEMDPSAPPPEPDRVLRALGMCIVRGQVDEVGGRILPVAALESA